MFPGLHFSLSRELVSKLATQRSGGMAPNENVGRLGSKVSVCSISDCIVSFPDPQYAWGSGHEPKVTAVQ